VIFPDTTDAGATYGLGGATTATRSHPYAFDSNDTFSAPLAVVDAVRDGVAVGLAGRQGQKHFRFGHIYDGTRIRPATGVKDCIAGQDAEIVSPFLAGGIDPFRQRGAVLEGEPRTPGTKLVLQVVVEHPRAWRRIISIPAQGEGELILVGSQFLDADRRGDGIHRNQSRRTGGRDLPQFVGGRGGDDVGSIAQSDGLLPHPYYTSDKSG
jgi:hypothetical protein